LPWPLDWNTVSHTEEGDSSGRDFYRAKTPKETKMRTRKALLLFTTCSLTLSFGLLLVASLLAEDKDADYFNGQRPCMDGIRLGAYARIVDNHLVLPLLARVFGSDGGFANAPITFTVAEGKALFESGKSLEQQVTLQAGADGTVAGWLWLPVNFTATNLVTITAGGKGAQVQARMLVGLEDFSGTGTLQINTKKLPMPYALAPKFVLLNGSELGGESAALMASGANGEIFLSDDLFLEPRAFTDDTLYLRLWNTVPGQTYQLLSTNLLTTNQAPEWALGEIITGASATNFTDFEPLEVGAAENTFYRAHQASNIVHVDRSHKTRWNLTRLPAIPAGRVSSRSTTTASLRM
jgi:hypothetical protein